MEFFKVNFYLFLLKIIETTPLERRKMPLLTNTWYLRFIFKKNVQK